MIEDGRRKRRAAGCPRTAKNEKTAGRGSPGHESKRHQEKGAQQATETARGRRSRGQQRRQWDGGPVADGNGGHERRRPPLHEAATNGGVAQTAGSDGYPRPQDRQHGRQTLDGHRPAQAKGAGPERFLSQPFAAQPLFKLPKKWAAVQFRGRSLVAQPPPISTTPALGNQSCAPFASEGSAATASSFAMTTSSTSKEKGARASSTKVVRI